MTDNTTTGSSASASDDKVPEVVPSKSPPNSKRPNTGTSLTKQIDRTILRLNKLLASPGGLSAFLSTVNYSLYVLAYLQSQSPSIANHARTLLSFVKSTSSKPATATLVSDGAIPPIAALAGLISRARTTLRLFGLFPLYAWFRSLTAGAKPGQDPVLHGIAVTQCVSYIAYQALENVCVLADNGIVPKKVVASLNRGDSTTARLYLWAYRAWLSGISCDLLRLGREAQIEGRKRAERGVGGQARGGVDVYCEEDMKVDGKWWTDLMIAGAWLPMAVHFSSGTGGIPGWNLGWMGVCGLVAGSSRARGLWRATLHP